MTNSGQLLGLLDVIESHEDALLSWGVVDGGLSIDELHQIVLEWTLAHDPFGDVDAIIEEMQDHGLLFYDDALEPPRWRSRIAEGLRLIARLRQMFPANNAAEAWRRGTPLVADFRYMRRPRSFPRRDLDWTATLDGLTDPDGALRRCLDSLTATRAGSLALSGFQVRATREVISALQSKKSTGVVVGAGTGSGKTLSFYLPAYAYLASLQDESVWTRCLAIYPRNELLRDQFTSAFAYARRSDRLFEAETGRKLRIGAFYGAAPTSASTLDTKFSQWRHTPDGYLCPYLTCPGDQGQGCAGDLHWPDEYVKGGEELLVCAACGARFGEDTIVITRQRMKTVAPDIVFSTTEMLNRSMIDLSSGPILGIGVPEPKRPRLVLLDEIHTYGGASGAQTAMVLRRWRHRVSTPVTFVGLSATLVDAGNYFANLVGVSATSVQSIEPAPDELTSEGAEYFVAARSDPTSGSSVLSATIQATMLLSRLLDAPKSGLSAGGYGSKTFVFTDDLDVTNRLYYDLADAEGLRLASSGRAVPGRKEPLAALRNPALGGGIPRRLAGQSWDLPELLGHPIDASGRLRIGRTSSQDTGVDSEAQAVVATASLEVGFDDPTVGAVIQHKAPRDAAQFIQRKGRAGRPRGMRPITLVVLSDYGRDRAAYEGWDSLFDPVLPPRTLPIHNRAVLRMHAAQSLLEWVAIKIRTTHPGANLWQGLQGPPEGAFARRNAELHAKAVEVLETLLAEPSAQSDLARWLRLSLSLTSSEVDEILWHPPRPVLLGAVPTLIRRLRSRFASATATDVIDGADTVSDHPLPDYFPGNLFTELSLSEVDVVVPSQSSDASDVSVEPMGVAQMMREYAPGRVSRRFATRNAWHRHWVPVDWENSESTQEVSAFIEDFDISAIPQITHRGRLATYEVVRPHRASLTLVPEEITDSSNAHLTWCSQFVEQGVGIGLRLPSTDRMGALIPAATFFLHAQSTWVQVSRLAVESDATVQFEDGTERRTRTQFVHRGAPAGLGVTLDVDALRLDVDLPTPTEDAVASDRGLRSAWFAHLITTDEALLIYANVLQLVWLHEAMETMLVLKAAERGDTLEETYRAISGSLIAHLQPTLEALFQRPGLVLGDNDIDSQPSKLLQRLTALLNVPAVVSRLDDLMPQLWLAPTTGMMEWLRKRLLSTVGQAAYAAARTLCPDHDPDGLLVDVEPGLNAEGIPRRNQVWLSEPTMGGGGFLEALARRIQADPRRFLRLMWGAIQPGPAERVGQQLTTVVNQLGSDNELTVAVALYRSSENQQSRVSALRAVREAASGMHIFGDEQMFISNLANRIMRPNTSHATDTTLQTLLADRSALEETLGVEISTRTWAFIASGSAIHDSALGVTPGSDAQQRRIDIILSLLWPTGWRVRADALRTWNPFAELPDPLPELLRALAPDEAPTVSIHDSEVERRIRELLAANDQVRVEVPRIDLGLASSLIVNLTVTPVESEWMFLHPGVVEVERASNGNTLLTFETAEGTR
ncbi:protein DpdJ [Mycolicibacterium nivoides]|uniref:protein DpdJ n=1 Tax=Mycolicibacterium nivoides TaxID=2487344 RepID=UPI003C2E2BED